MLCSRCGMDQPREWFGPSAENWPKRRECQPCRAVLTSRKRHGLTPIEKAQIAAQQGGCRICGHPEPGAKGWCVDHDRGCCPGDYSCPKCRRGVLCQWCNSMLGYSFDRTETLRAAAAYLDAERSCDWHVPVACAPSICGAHIHVRTETTDGLTEKVVDADGHLKPRDAHEKTAINTP